MSETAASTQPAPITLEMLILYQHSAHEATRIFVSLVKEYAVQQGITPADVICWLQELKKEFGDA